MRLDGVEHLGGNVEAVYADTLVNDLAKLLLAAGEHDLKIKLLGRIRAVNKAEVLRDALVEDQTARSRVYDSGLASCRLLPWTDEP